MKGARKNWNLLIRSLFNKYLYRLYFLPLGRMGTRGLPHGVAQNRLKRRNRGGGYFPWPPQHLPPPKSLYY